MNIKKYLKNLWNDLKYDETGQVSWGAIPKSLYTKTPAQLGVERYKKFITSPGATQKFAGTEAGKLEQLYKQSQAPVTQPPAITGGGGGAAATYQAPAYAFPEIDLSGIWETAGMMADNEINPQLAEIDRLLQEAGYTAEDSQRAISEAYPIARRSLQKSIYENMVAGEQGLAAMGTGRGGGRQELLARAGEREATGLEAIETQKQREVGAIQRALGQYQGQLGTRRIGLEGMRGGLQAGYAEQLRGARFNEAATMANYGLNAAQLAEQARQFNATLAGVGTTAAGGQPYAATPSGTSYFLTDKELEALGLKTITTGTTAVKKAVTPSTIWQGKPLALQSYQMQLPRY